MASLARILFASLAISVASLTPVLPSSSVTIIQQKHSCCADMSMDASQRCPINPSGTNSTSSMCCTGPAVCLLLYFSGSNDFIPGVLGADWRDLFNPRVTARSHRPPVPPPRVAFS
jgi:hypothetical protein